MRNFVLSAAFALGVGIAGIGGASAATLGTGIGTAAQNYTPMAEKVAVVCRRVEVCRWRHGVRVCHIERVCRRRW